MHSLTDRTKQRKENTDAEERQRSYHAVEKTIQLTAVEEEANRFAEKYPLSKSADINKKHQWLAISAKLCKSTFRVRQHLSAELVTVEMAKPWLVRCWRAFKKQKASL